MYGFCFCVNEEKRQLNILEGYDLQEIDGENWFCMYNKLPKFENDKLFFKRNNLFILLDGVILNKIQLIEKYCGEKGSWEEAFYSMIVSDDGNMRYITELRGSFSGIIYDEVKNDLIAFTDFMGDKGIFYWADEGKVIVSSNIRIVDGMMKASGKKVVPDSQGCHEMLVTGSCLHGNTVIKGVKRLLGGKLLRGNRTEVTEYRYHMYHNIPEHELSLEECIDKADGLFRNAVKQIYEKNVEYGYDMEADLSGGLDSRLVTWVAYDLGYRDVLNVCWCMKNKIDHTSSRNIANRLNNRYFFYPMDDGDFLMDVDEVNSITGGVVSYFIGTGVNRALKQLDLSNIGMEITGLMGELHNAYWIEGSEHTNPRYYNNRDFTRTISLKYPESYCDDYDNFEQMNLYEFSGLLYLSSCFIRNNRLEVLSPFMDKDFLEFAYKVPLKWRKDHYFTMAWMCNKYPGAAKFVWQAEMKPVDRVFYRKPYLPWYIWKLERMATTAYNLLCTRFKIESKIAYKNDMNPVDMWFSTNPNIREFYKEYYLSTRGLVKSGSLRKDMETMMKNRRGFEQMAVVNFLSIYKMYFKEN